MKTISTTIWISVLSVMSSHSTLVAFAQQQGSSSAPSTSSSPEEQEEQDTTILTVGMALGLALILVVCVIAAILRGTGCCCCYCLPCCRNQTHEVTATDTLRRTAGGTPNTPLGVIRVNDGGAAGGGGAMMVHLNEEGVVDEGGDETGGTMVEIPLAAIDPDAAMVDDDDEQEGEGGVNHNSERRGRTAECMLPHYIETGSVFTRPYGTGSYH